MNFGAILRCAYYMQVDRLFSPKLNRSDIFTAHSSFAVVLLCCCVVVC
jgi:tRNA G18 (ribose-2'-O)-methylase SpoU